jgi:G:T-mismatch repair DNA endonuclease (very short patch repair protein)
MADVYCPEQRSKNMAAIKGKNTEPDILYHNYDNKLIIF